MFILLLMNGALQCHRAAVPASFLLFSLVFSCHKNVHLLHHVEGKEAPKSRSLQHTG